MKLLAKEMTDDASLPLRLSFTTCERGFFTMSKDGFEQDDLSSTLARFAGKGRSIVHDESKLKRKAQEPVAFSSATQDLGGAVFSCMSSVMRSVVSNRPRESSTEYLDDVYEPLQQNGWRNGARGYGYYRNGIKD